MRGNKFYFLMNVDDHPLVLENAKVTMCVVDTSISYSSKLMEQINSAVNNLSNLKSWTAENKLPFNITNINRKRLGNLQNITVHIVKSGAYDAYSLPLIKVLARPG